MNGFGTCGAHEFTISLSHGPYRNERLKLPKKVLRVRFSPLTYQPLRSLRGWLQSTAVLTVIAGYTLLLGLNGALSDLQRVSSITI